MYINVLNHTVNWILTAYGHDDDDDDDAAKRISNSVTDDANRSQIQGETKTYLEVGEQLGSGDHSLQVLVYYKSLPPQKKK